MLARLTFLTEISRHRPLTIELLGYFHFLHTILQLELVVEGCHVELLGKVLLDKLGGSRYTVKVSVQVLMRHRTRHLLITDLRIDLILTYIVT